MQSKRPLPAQRLLRPPTPLPPLAPRTPLAPLVVCGRRESNALALLGLDPVLTSASSPARHPAFHSRLAPLASSPAISIAIPDVSARLYGTVFGAVFPLLLVLPVLLILLALLVLLVQS